MTIYCDNELCNQNEDGFCWAEKLHIDSNGCCTKWNVPYTEECGNEGAENGDKNDKC